MSNLNMLHAQEADLKNRVSDTGLVCDSPRGVPDSKDVDAFRLVMKGEHNLFPGSRDAFASHLPAEKQAPFVPEDNVLFSAEDKLPFTDDSSQTALSAFFSMVNTFTEVEGTAKVEALHAVLTEEELSLLVDRILVSVGDEGTQEVRLTLGERFLNGTEIVLSRNLEGKLVVALNCIDQSSFQTLVASQFDLKAKLEEHELIDVEISVNIDQESNDSDRRSRGFYALDPDELWKTDNA